MRKICLEHAGEQKTGGPIASHLTSRSLGRKVKYKVYEVHSNADDNRNTEMVTVPKRLKHAHVWYRRHIYSLACTRWAYTLCTRKLGGWLLAVQGLSKCEPHQKRTERKTSVRRFRRPRSVSSDQSL